MENKLSLYVYMHGINVGWLKMQEGRETDGGQLRKFFFRTDFTDTRTALQFFSVSVFFLVFSYRFFFPF